MEGFLFSLYGLVAAGSAIGVVLSQNVARMAFWLVISLSAVAGLFFMLNADFIAATQLLIYVGGTVVLLIFGVMLTSSGPFLSLKSNPAEVLQAGLLGVAFLAVVVPVVTSVNWSGNNQVLSQAGIHTHPGSYNQQGEGNSSRRLGTALLGFRFDQLHLEDAGQHAVASPMADHTHAASAAVEADHAHAADAAEHGHGHPHPHPHAPGAGPQIVIRENSPAGNGYLLPFEIVSVHLLVVLIGASYLARAKRRVSRPEEGSQAGESLAYGAR